MNNNAISNMAYKKTGVSKLGIPERSEAGLVSIVDRTFPTFSGLGRSDVDFYVKDPAIKNGKMRFGEIKIEPGKALKNSNIPRVRDWVVDKFLKKKFPRIYGR